MTTLRRAALGLALAAGIGLAIAGPAAAEAPPPPGGKAGKIITNVQLRIATEQQGILTALAPVQAKAEHALGLAP